MSRAKAKRDKGNWKHVDGGMAFVIPLSLLRHANWIRLRAVTVKLILDLGRQYSGFNNGYLCPAWELMKKQGWKSKETLYIAIAEAEHFSILTKTRRGGRNRPNLYALSWWPIHGKEDNPLDISPSLQPSNAWKEEAADFMLPDWIAEKRRKTKTLHAQRTKP